MSTRTDALFPYTTLVRSQVHRDVGAFARGRRLAHPAARQFAARVELGWQKVGVAAMRVPQQRQDAVVAEQRLPRRLDQLQPGARQMLAERLAEQVFQRIQLEQAADPVVVEVGDRKSTRLNSSH